MPAELTADFSERGAYQSTGKVNWLVFLPCAAMTILLSIVMAFCLSEAFFRGYYFIIIAPIIAVLPVLGAIYLTISLGKCRSRVLAVLLAIVSAVLVFPGYFHACLIRQFGPVVAPHVELLWPYIQIRMATDEAVDAAKPNNQPQPKVPNNGHKGMNWFAFGSEFLIVWCACIGAAITRSSRAFCENCDAWLEQHKLSYAPGTGQKILSAFQAGQLASLRNLITVPSGSKTSVCEISVECCTDGESCPTYFSLRDLSLKGGLLGWVVRLFQNQKGSRLSWLLKQAELTPHEIADLSHLLPKLKSLPSVRELPADERATEKTAHATETGRLPRELAIVQTVPSPYGGQVLSKGHVLIGTFISLLPLLLLPLAAAAIIAAVAYHEKIPVAGTALLAVAGIGLGATALFYLIFYSDFLPSLYLMSLCKREFDRRIDCWVDYRDEDAIAIQVVPRPNWGRIMLENASDVGFLKIDTIRGELLFEGDHERYRIPAGSMISWEIESFTLPGDQDGSNPYYLVILRAQTENGLWESPIAHRHVTGKPRGAKQRKVLAEELQKQITQILPELS